MIEARSAALPAPWFRRNVRLVDVGLVVFVLLLNIAGVWMQRVVGEADSVRFGELHPVSLMVNLLTTVSLLWRRRYPVAIALGVNAINTIVGLFVFISVGGSVAALVALYTLGAYCTLRRGLAALGAIVLASSAYLPFAPQFESGSDEVTIGWLVVVSGLASIGVWGIGVATRSRRAYLEELESRAERLERTRSAEVRAALAEERTRVARELHDVVAHHVSVMTVQAAAARRIGERAPERSAEAMRAVEETGRAALGEMRRIVGALRDTEAAAGDAPTAHAPQPGVDELEPVLERAKGAGLQVELLRVGTPGPVPSGVDLAVFRVVQEALTNTLKHAGRTRAAVKLRYDYDELSVRVLDDGPSWLTAAPSRPGTDTASTEPEYGQGLVGMRERVHLNGGTLRTGPRPDGGYEVFARFPFNGFEESPTGDPTRQSGS